MFKKIHINEMERGFVYDGQDLIRYLKPGKHWINLKKDQKIELMSTDQNIQLPMSRLKYLCENEMFKSEVAVLDVQDHEAAMRFVDGKFKSLYTSGFYVFWQTHQNNTFKLFDMNELEIKASTDRDILMQLAISQQDILYFRVVESHEKGLCFIDHQIHEMLNPGRYLFWNYGSRVQIQTVDLRVKVLDVVGQEILTSDKVPLRVNFTCQYHVMDVIKVLTEFKRHEEQVYNWFQLILRELIGTMSFDELMAQKHALGNTVLQRAAKDEGSYGIEIKSAGIKDIILPGDIREIMNTVLIAEKRAAANVITRREETASTRSLLNTAKLMEENKTLSRLKELEYIERICDRIGSVSLAGNQGLLEQLQNALLPR